MRNKNYSTLLAFVITITSLLFTNCTKSDLTTTQTSKNTTTISTIVKEGYVVLDRAPYEILLSLVEFRDGTYYSPLSLTNPVSGDFTLELYSTKNDKLVASRAVSFNDSYVAQEFKVPFGRYYLKIKDTENGVYRNLPCPPNPTTKIAYFDVNTEEKPDGFRFIVIEKLQ